MKRIILSLIIFLFVQSIVAQTTKELIVATYNVRYNNAGDSLNSWPNRKENVKALIRFHEFDIFGIQEGLIEQVKGIAELNEFAYYGKGRDDGKEGAANIRQYSIKKTGSNCSNRAIFG